MALHYPTVQGLPEGVPIRILRDNVEVAVVACTADVMPWFHRNTAASMWHALNFKG